MDIHETKDRIAAALVESIFRRARYTVRPVQTNSTVTRFVREDFAPNFHASLTTEDGKERDFLVDVTYRPFLDPFIDLENQRRDASVFVLARRQWPNLRSVLVTDHPEPNRSCFQAVYVDHKKSAPRLRTANLGEAEEFDIFPHNVTDHQELLLRIFVLLSADRRQAARV